MPKPTTLTLASGQVNKSDQLDVELHQPADLPAFILVKWPDAPSLASLDSFDSLVAAVYRVMSDAMTTVSRLRGSPDALGVSIGSRTRSHLTCRPIASD